MAGDAPMPTVISRVTDLEVKLARLEEHLERLARRHAQRLANLEDTLGIVPPPDPEAGQPERAA